MDFPKTIHDFCGFPQALLFDAQHPAPGNPALAMETASLIHSAQVELDHDWGLEERRSKISHSNAGRLFAAFVFIGFKRKQWL